MLGDVPGRAHSKAGFIADQDDDQLVDQTAAAKFLDQSPRTLESWRARGIGPAFVRLNGRGSIKYRVRDLRDYVARFRRSTAEQA